MNFFRRFQQLVPQIFVAISSLIAVRFHLTMNSSSPRGKLEGETTASDGSVVATRKLLTGVSLSTNKGKTEVISNSYHDSEERLERARKANEMNGKSREEEKEEEKVQVEINNSFRQLDNVSEPSVELGKPVKNNWCLLGPLLLLSIILVALGVGYILNASSESADNPDEDLFLEGPEASWLLTPTAVPGIDATTNNEDDVFLPTPTPSPSTLDFIPDDSSPSSPPVLYNWVFDLPVYSRDALKIPNSAQNKAVDWMLVLPTEIISSMQPWQTKQLFALVTFYFSMNGPDWPQEMGDWLNDYNDIGDECNWSFSPDPTGQHSQPCNPATGRYRALLLHELELAVHRPILPKELALLSELESIQLAGNEIYAPLDDMAPLRLFRLDYLTHIDLSDNLLYGTIPLDLSWFTALQTLRLQNNRLEGPIPSSLGETLSDLKELNLSYNSLTGTIPSELGLMTSLTLLDLSYNNIDFWTNGVPDELLALADLKIVL